MKLAHIEVDGRSRLAVPVDGEFIDLTDRLGVTIDKVWEFLGSGEQARSAVRRCLTAGGAQWAANAVKLRAPVQLVDKVLGVGMNYRSFVMAAERLGVPLPKHLLWFLRPRSCISGPYADVLLPRGARDLDYEAELAVVIGRRCRGVKAAQAPEVVAGFTVANDLTLREQIVKSITLGKSFDTHTPLGPWLVTAEDIDPRNLLLRSWVNGELRQNSNTNEMISSCYELIEQISALCTLNPGDIILTGTPDGCGILCTPPRALAVGDVVKVEIEGIGSIENRVVDEIPQNQ